MTRSYKNSVVTLPASRVSLSTFPPRAATPALALAPPSASPSTLTNPSPSHAETKVTRSQLDAKLATPLSHDAFYSFFRGASNKPRGIHGTAIFTRRSTTVPLKAEEGLSASLLPASLVEEERIGGYPGEELGLSWQELRELDCEGRTTVCDFGMFVLINL